MPAAKKNSTAIKQTDGRRNNGRKPGTQVQRSQKKLTPASLNKAKKTRMKLYSINAIIDEFGSEQEFFNFLAKQSKKSFNHLKLMMEYGYGKPDDGHQHAPQKQAPIINFYGSAPQIDNTIDIDHDEEE